MDITTIVGAISGVFMILIGILARGGNINGFIDVPSVLITFGGTFAASLINYPLKQVVNVFRITKKVLTQKEEDPAELIEKFVTFTKIANKEGLLALEARMKTIDNEFLKRGIKLVVDGADQDRINDELETEINFMEERHRVGQEIFITLGTYAPAFGMIGTIIGLILMLAKLEDQSQIASGMAVALLTTFYGAVAGYLIFLPTAGKLKRRSEDEIFIKRIIIQGVISLQSGELPSVMGSKLKAYLPREEVQAKKEEGKTGGKKEAKSGESKTD